MIEADLYNCTLIRFEIVAKVAILCKIQYDFLMDFSFVYYTICIFAIWVWFSLMIIWLEYVDAA